MKKKNDPNNPTELSSTTIPLPPLRSVFLKVHQYCSKSPARKKKKVNGKIDNRRNCSTTKLILRTRPVQKHIA